MCRSLSHLGETKWAGPLALLTSSASAICPESFLIFILIRLFKWYPIVYQLTLVEVWEFMWYLIRCSCTFWTPLCGYGQSKFFFNINHRAYFVSLVLRQRMLQHRSVLQCADPMSPACLHVPLCTKCELLPFWNHIFTIKVWGESRFNLTDGYLWLWSFVPSSQKWIRLPKFPSYFSYKTSYFPQFSMAVARCFNGWNLNTSRFKIDIYIYLYEIKLLKPVTCLYRLPIPTSDSFYTWACHK